MTGPPALALRRGRLEWRRTVIMGVLNVTPDSFSDAGRFVEPDVAVARGAQLARAGAEIVDVGGESTRPGSLSVTAAVEIDRVVPVIERLAHELDRSRLAAAVSVDTCKAEVADRACEAGAEIVNDVSGGLLDAALLEVVARRGSAIILGHLRGRPLDMLEHARYADVAGEVADELRGRVEAARRAGIAPERILVDPGFGFAKTAEQSLQLLAELARVVSLGYAVVVGLSRKSFLGAIAERPVEGREIATAAADTAAILAGANVVRVHDVELQRDAVRVADALRSALARSAIGRTAETA